MRKNNKWNSFKFIVIGIFLMYSCKSDFLTERIDNRTLIKTLPEMEALLAAVSPAADHLFTDYMSDDYEYLFQHGGIHKQKFQRLLPIYDFHVSLLKCKCAFITFI